MRRTAPPGTRISCGVGGNTSRRPAGCEESASAAHTRWTRMLSRRARGNEDRQLRRTTTVVGPHVSDGFTAQATAALRSARPPDHTVAHSGSSVVRGSAFVTCRTPVRNRSLAGRAAHHPAPAVHHRRPRRQPSRVRRSVGRHESRADRPQRFCRQYRRPTIVRPVHRFGSWTHRVPETPAPLAAPLAHRRKSRRRTGWSASRGDRYRRAIPRQSVSTTRRRAPRPAAVAATAPALPTWFWGDPTAATSMLHMGYPEADEALTDLIEAA